MSSKLSDFDYPLPETLIAQEPLKRRSDARLLVVDRRAGRFSHHHVRDLPELLHAGDRLVLNDTLVLPARLMGYRTESGGRWQGLFLSTDPQHRWRLLCKTRGKLRAGESITLVNRAQQNDVRIKLLHQGEGGVWLAQCESSETPADVLGRIGGVPLPHYIRSGVMRDEDVAAYQTVYARRPGSAAAPTAGLHFTLELLQRLRQEGVAVTGVTLHIGLDTFRPIAEPDLESHAMHSEWAELSEKGAADLAATRAAGGRICAVGTTTVRVLETAAVEGEIRAWRGPTDLFIRPPHEFRAVDALLTNFHLPRSTLLVLVAALAGRELILAAYQEAIREQYRFYSYGDAMLIV